jgi:hypothetical protein
MASPDPLRGRWQQAIIGLSGHRATLGAVGPGARFMVRRPAHDLHDHEGVILASHKRVVQDSTEVATPVLSVDFGRVPDRVRQRAAELFVDVVELRERLQTIIEEYRFVAGAVQVCADEIDDYDRAIRLDEQLGVRLTFDLLVDMSYRIVEATGWEPPGCRPGSGKVPTQGVARDGLALARWC